MELQGEFNLALYELVDKLSPKSFYYLESLLKEYEGNDIRNTQYQRMNSKIRPNSNIIAKKKKISLDDLDYQETISNRDWSCNQLPICRRILSKSMKFYFIRKQRKTETDDMTSFLFSKSPKLDEDDEIIEESIYKKLVGKIYYAGPPPVLKRMKELELKRAEGVRDMSHAISNPLYRIYSPRGYIKSEDEIVKEIIEEITKKLNDWLESIEGGLDIKINGEDLYRILRLELEVPNEKDLKKVEEMIKFL